MLIYHTHSSETYSDSSKNNYHSTDIENSVMSVGSVLTTELSEKGWGVIHSTKYNDLAYNEAYATSGKTVPSSIDIIGYLSQSFAQCSISSSEVYSVPAFGSL